MSTLEERIKELMTAMEWNAAKVASIAGVSHSAVSQWLGNSTKPVNSIGSIEAAEKLSNASGYCSLWIAKGKGPKLRPNVGTGALQAPSGSLQTPDLSIADHLSAIGGVIASSDELTRAQIKPILDQLLKTPEQADDLGQRLQATVSMRSGQTPFVPNNPFPKK